MPEGYSSLGGQVLLPSDTDKTPAGSSGGSAAATAAGLAALTVGLETSTDTAQLIAPAGVAGVVGLKPTVGLVSRDGVLPVAKSQDSPGPIARTVWDVAAELQAIAGADPKDPATRDGAAANYLRGLVPTALQGKQIAVISQHDRAVPDRGHRAAGGRARRRPSSRRSARRARTRRASSTREFKRDLNAYLAGTTRRRRQVAAGDHRLQHREPGRGPEVPAGRADRRAGDRPADPATATAYDVGQDDRQGVQRARSSTRLLEPTTTTRSWCRAATRLVGHRRPRRLPGADRPGRLRHGRRGPQPDRRHVRRHGLQRADAARRRLRLRAGDERAARAELHEPEHVALRPGQHVLLAASSATRATA